MIQAKDLRIGNWIYDPECAPHYFQVECIYQRCHGKYWVSYRDESIKIAIGEVVPIKLTEEILLKCGFEKAKRDYSMGNDDVYGAGSFFIMLTVDGFAPCYETFDRDDFTIWREVGKEVKYLHQLQNLYWCLTGEELNVQL